MMRLPKTMTTVLLSAALSATLVGAAVAKHDLLEGHHVLGWMHEVQELRLSSEQKTQVKQLVSDWQLERKQVSEQQQTSRLALFNAADFDPLAARQWLQVEQEQQITRDIQALQLQHAVYQLLDEQQRLKLEQELAERRDEEEDDDHEG